MTQAATGTQAPAHRPLHTVRSRRTRSMQLSVCTADCCAAAVPPFEQAELAQDAADRHGHLLFFPASTLDSHRQCLFGLQLRYSAAAAQQLPQQGCGDAGADAITFVDGRAGESSAEVRGAAAASLGSICCCRLAAGGMVGPCCRANRLLTPQTRSHAKQQLLRFVRAPGASVPAGAVCKVFQRLHPSIGRGGGGEGHEAPHAAWTAKAYHPRLASHC